MLLLVSFAIVASTVSHAEESAQDGLQRCGLIDDTSARIACYDQLGGREKLAVAKIIESPALPPDDLGAESLTGRERQQKPEPVSVSVKVTKCVRRGGNQKYIFYLEGGQVWKQTSDRRLNFKECNFGASIIKDFFGYKMHLDNVKKKLRVSRIH